MSKSFRLAMTMLVLILAVGMVVSACSSGTGNNGSKEQEVSQSPGGEPTTPGDQDEKPITLSMFMYGERKDGFNPSDNPIVNRVGELTNVDLEVELVPSVDFDTKFRLMLASGKLPDIVNDMFTLEQSYEAARAGAFIDLKEYYDNSPTIQKYVTPEMMELSKDPVTGNYWRIPMAWDKAMQGSGVIARYDLIEKYNNGVWPESVEQWVDLMRVIKKDNPTKSVFTNRNLGDSLFSYGGMPIFAMYGVSPYEYRIMSGEVIPSVLLPEYRAAVTVMRQLYSEGILDKEFATVTSEQYWAKLENDLILLDYNESAGMLWNANHAANNIKDERKYLMAPDLKQPPAELADMKYTYGFRNSPIIDQGVYISSNSKDPDRAWKVIEAFTSDELVEDIFWGEEGKTFKVEDGNKIPDVKALEEEWTRYSHYYAFVPGYQAAPDLTQAKTALSLGDEYTQEIYDSINYRVEKAFENGFGTLTGFVPSEAASLKTSESMQRINQFTVKAIMGELSMEQFDQEVAKWEKDFRSVIYDEIQAYVDANKDMLRNYGVKMVDW